MDLYINRLRLCRRIVSSVYPPPSLPSYKTVGFTSHSPSSSAHPRVKKAALTIRPPLALENGVFCCLPSMAGESFVFVQKSLITLQKSNFLIDGKKGSLATEVLFWN